MKIGWATDIHLDFVEPKRFNTFTNQVNDAGIDHLLISGDLAVADILRDRFQKLASTLNSDITFVLGNFSNQIGILSIMNSSYYCDKLSLISKC
ncbi:metallophosphoesterase [Verrucomicrobiales bacterium]|nr:metallophosphoesterase [Verrucomicrobiales bacterium]